MIGSDGLVLTNHHVVEGATEITGTVVGAEGQVTALGQTITATDQNGGNAETLNDLIGTNAGIQAGQSGGPLVDASGDVVGVDVAAASGYTWSGTGGYAIPIDDAKAVVERILSGQETGSVQIGATPFLGVELAADPTASFGAYPGWGFSGGYSDPSGSKPQDTRPHRTARTSRASRSPASSRAALQSRLA